MAIYSLRLTPIGKTTQKAPFTAAAHIRYITRASAASHVMSARMPDDPRAAMRWLRKEERADRINARVADKFVIALPRELTLRQNIVLVADYAERLTRGRAQWIAAIHAKGKDRNNPHCHLLVRDRDRETGERVALFSAGPKEVRQRAAKGLEPPITRSRVRELWEQAANQALALAGRGERIDRRRLVEQGQYRLAQVHEGPNIRAMHARGVRPLSKEHAAGNRALRKKGTPVSRVVRYQEIDGGLTRVEYNAYVREAPGLSMTEAVRRQERVARHRQSGSLDRTPTRGR
jgi:MobA/MobL family